MATNAQEVATEEELRGIMREALQKNDLALAEKIAERIARQPQFVGEVEVDRSPFPAPEPVQAGKRGGTTGSNVSIPPFDMMVDPLREIDRERAERGVDYTQELTDKGLRSAIGFSPGQDFTIDFLSRKLSEQTGLPAERVVRFSPRGDIEFFNPETRRFTPLDSTTVTKADLADIYGPSVSIAPATLGAMAGAIVGPVTSIGGGGFGAFIGEGIRLIKGKTLDVHDLSEEEMFNRAVKAAGFDVAGGTLGQLLVELRVIWRSIRSPEGFTPDSANSILSNLGKNQETVDRINSLLSRGRRVFKLDPVADAEDALGLEMREVASRSDDYFKAQRATELKANDSALDEFARRRLGITDLDSDILTNEGAERAARPAQTALRAERDRIQAVADRNLAEAEFESRRVLSTIGDVNHRQAGQDARGLVTAHYQALNNAKIESWAAYERAIGQVSDDPAKRLVSDIQVPITPEVRAAHKAAQKAKEQSLLTRKAQGPRTIKKPEVGATIDLAVLDDDIKEIRDILRRGDPGFSTRGLRQAERQLVKLRNEYLKNNDPDALALLEKAEQATAMERTFVNESVFSSILKATPDGKFVLDDVSVFKRIFLDDTGAMMHELVDVAKGQVGGLAALQETALQVYKASVIPEGSNFISRELHNSFIRKHQEVLSILFKDPKMLRFGNLEKAVARTTRRAELTQAALSRSALARFGGTHPEKMAAALFKDQVSQANVRTAYRVLDAAGPEALESWQDSIGREIYRRITTDNAISPTKISNILEQYGGKLSEVYGPQFVRDLETLRKGILLNITTQAGPNLPKQNLIGQLARSFITPPLSRRGRFQTFIEGYRYEASMRAINAAVRDPDVLRAIVINAERDIRDARVANLLGQIGATSLALEEQK